MTSARAPSRGHWPAPSRNKPMSETKTETKCRCGNCGWTGPESALRCGLTEIEDFWSRVSPGEVVPDGECPECGGLAHAVAIHEASTQNQNTHSPGPWLVGREYSNAQDEIEDAEGRTLAVVWTRTPNVPAATARPCWTDDPRGKANARLIAAAPELLASLSEIVRKSYLRPGQHEDCHVHPDLIARARAVLASIQQSA